MQCNEHLRQTHHLIRNPAPAHVDHVVVGKKTDDGNYQ